MVEDQTENSKATEEKPVENELDRANKIAERLEAANKVKAELLAREERLEATRRLGGRSEAGIAAKEKSKKEITKESAEKLLKGSGMNPFADDGALALEEEM